MPKIITFFWCVCIYQLPLFANDKKFRIEGDVDTIYNGCSIQLEILKNKETIVLDSIEISNGKFSFSGEVFTDNYSYLYLDHKENPIDRIILLEEGLINVDLRKGINKVSGTKLNDTYQAYIDTFAFYKEKIPLECFTPSDFYTQFYSFVEKTIIQNLSNIVGYNMFQYDYRFFDDSIFERLIDVF